MTKWIFSRFLDLTDLLFGWSNVYISFLEWLPESWCDQADPEVELFKKQMLNPPN